jgi:hypothetical protein
MLKISRRVERLEEEMIPEEEPPPEILTLCFVDSNKNVVETLEFPLRVPPSTGRFQRSDRRWRNRRNR